MLFQRVGHSILAKTQEIELRVLPLAFHDRKLEQAFQDDYFQRTLNEIRYALVLGMVAVGIFAITDLALFDPPVSTRLLILRFAGSWSGFLALLALTYSGWARRALQWGLAALVVWVGLTILGMIWVGLPTSYDYYVGLVLTFIFAFIIARIRFIYVVPAGLIILLLYEILVNGLLDTPLSTLLIGNLFMIVTYFVCLVVSYLIEFRTRTEFYWKHELEAATLKLAAAQNELIEQERMATLGKLAAAMAHEMRNPLGVIANATYLLESAPAEAGQLRSDYLEIIKNEVKGVTRIVSSLLDFTSPHEAELAVCQVSQVIRDALDLVDRPDSVRVEVKTLDGLPALWCDSVQVHKALACLIDNAVHAMPGGGLLTIRAEQSGEQIAIAITDTGVGIPEEEMDRLFEPLYTTRARGLGLGLPRALRWIEASGGKIFVESQVGEGSAFHVRLPAATTGRGLDPST